VNRGSQFERGRREVRQFYRDNIVDRLAANWTTVKAQNRTKRDRPGEGFKKEEGPGAKGKKRVTKKGGLFASPEE